MIDRATTSLEQDVQLLKAQSKKFGQALNDLKEVLQPAAPEELALVKIAPAKKASRLSFSRKRPSVPAKEEVEAEAEDGGDNSGTRPEMARPRGLFAVDRNDMDPVTMGDIAHFEGMDVPGMLMGERICLGVHKPPLL